MPAIGRPGWCGHIRDHHPAVEPVPLEFFGSLDDCDAKAEIVWARTRRRGGDQPRNPQFARLERTRKRPSQRIVLLLEHARRNAVDQMLAASDPPPFRREFWSRLTYKPARRAGIWFSIRFACWRRRLVGVATLALAGLALVEWGRRDGRVSPLTPRDAGASQCAAIYEAQPSHPLDRAALALLAHAIRMSLVPAHRVLGTFGARPARTPSCIAIWLAVLAPHMISYSALSADARAVELSLPAQGGHARTRPRSSPLACRCSTVDAVWS